MPIEKSRVIVWTVLIAGSALVAGGILLTFTDSSAGTCQTRPEGAKSIGPALVLEQEALILAAYAPEPGASFQPGDAVHEFSTDPWGGGFFVMRNGCFVGLLHRKKEEA